MRQFRSASVDFVLTDPPYLVNYTSNDGRTVPNDDNDAWLKPAFGEIYRVLRWNRFCVSFYAWNRADKFIAAWRDAGFHIAGHLTFIKKYASRKRYLGVRPRERIFAREGQPIASGAADCRCDRVAIFRQQAAPDAETRLSRPPAAYSVVLATGRSRPRSVLRLRLNARCGAKRRS